ncbi:winged helix-turn-helix transcriptional regulator [Paenibacillus pabuli]|nr:winged helix-turn-helix transcriptional regulator [Paenibacillus pabuli]
MYFEELAFDLDRKVVLKNRVPVFLTAKEFKILEKLLKRPGKVFTRDELLELVWGFDYLGDSHNVDMNFHPIN